MSWPGELAPGELAVVTPIDSRRSCAATRTACTAWRMVGPDTAEDVTQQAFLQGVVRSGRVHPRGELWHLAVSDSDELLS
jgi:hypothetical protein